MRNIKILSFFLGLVLLASTSCGDRESEFPIDPTDIQNGAFLRVINNDDNSFEFDLLNIPTSQFSILLESFDPEEGTQVSTVDFFVDFVDQTPDNGTVERDQVFLMTVNASQFSVDPTSNLPRVRVSMDAATVLSALNLTETDIFGGDSFDFSWTLNLNDGRSFNNTNASNDVLTGAFFNSPFFQRVNVICSLPEGFFTGMYDMQVVDAADPFFGAPTRIAPGTVEVRVGLTSTQRLIDVTYVTFASTFIIDLVCEQVTVPLNPSGVGCGGPGLVWGPDETVGTYSNDSDQVIEVIYTENTAEGCGLGPTPGATLTFTRL